MFLSGRTALVTGGGRGIGEAIAVDLAKAGAKVVVTGRGVADLERVAGRLGGGFLKIDLGSREDLERGVTELTERFGNIDVLVNNAGIAESAPVQGTTDESWDRMFQINVHAPFALCRALLPGMVSRGFGRIVNISSNAGRAGYAYTSAYCATKHAVVGLTRALAAEVARSGVTVNAVCPGWVDTDMVREASVRISEKTRRTEAEAKAALAAMSPQKRLMEAAEIAHLVTSLMAHEARGIHGQAIVLDGGQVMA